MSPADRASDAAEDTPSSLPRPGRRLGRYELCAELARGGMAAVFLGRAHGLAGFEKLVAVKCIHSRYARERAFVEMFLDEARIASRITHPNVCGVFDVGEDGGVYYLAMDYLHGEALSSVMRALAARPDLRGPTWHALAAAIAAESAEGLHAAHELTGEGGELLRVVHRDVSPQNVFIGYDGTVRVVDFGIARAVGRLHKTLSGVVKGKVAYMSPEQLRGEEIDRRADVWALGVTLWEMLSGQRLFKRDSEGKQIRAVLEDEILRPSALAPEVPAELDSIVLRALRRNPADRWQTARELGRELRRHIASTQRVASGVELGEHMELLFARERREKDALVDRTRRLGPAAAVPDTERMDRAPADVVATVVPDPSATEITEDPSAIRPSSRRGHTTEREYPAMAAPPPIAPAPDPVPLPSPSPSPVEPQPADTTRRRWTTDSLVLPVRSRTLPWIAMTIACAAIVAAVLVFRDGDAAPHGDVLDDGARAATPAEPEPPVSGRRDPVPAPIEPPSPPVSMAAPPLPPEIAPPDRVTPAPAKSARRRAPREPAVAEPAPSRVPGTVIVGVEGGWGTITVDGRASGQAPRALTLPAGRHVIEVLPFGEPPVRRQVVDVSPGGTHRVVVRP